MMIQNLEESPNDQSQFLAQEIYDQKSNFDFEIDQTFTFEAIVRACFGNPERKKFETAQFEVPGSDNPLVNDDLGQDEILERMSRTDAITGFDNEKIRVYDNSRLDQTIDLCQWVSTLKTLKWYGPFCWDEDLENPEYIYFKTFSVNSEPAGFCLWISFTSKMVEFHYRDHEGKSCGQSHAFF